MPAIRLAFRLLRWAILFSLALALSAVAHLNTTTGRRAGRVIANVLVTDLIAGRLDIGRITELTPGRIVVRDVSLFDPRGTRVIHGHTIVLRLDLDAALDGILRFSRAEMHGGTLRLDEGDAGLTFLEALGARTPSMEPSTGEPFHAIVDNMRLYDIVAYGSMLGATGLHARNLRVQMRMEFAEEMDIRVYSGTGFIDGPMDFVAQLDGVTARVNSAPHEGSTVDARVHYESQRARAHLRYAVPRHQPIGSQPELDLVLEVDPIDLATVHRIGFDFAAPFHGSGTGFIRLHGPTDDLALDADLHHESGPIVLRGSLPSEGPIVIDASTTGLDLARLVPNTPSLPIGGRLRLEVQPEASGRPSTVHGDLEAFAFEGYAIPTLTVDATLLEDRVTIDAIDAPYGGTGRLRGEGYATYDGDVHVELGGSLGEIARDPNVQRHAAGARGRAQVRATIDRHDDTLTVDARGSIHAASISDVTANEVDFSLDSTTTSRGTRLSVETDAVDLRVGPIMLGDGSATLRSSGAGYAFEGSFEDPRVSGRTAVSGTLTTRGDLQVLDAPRIRYTRRGVELVVSADRIELAPRRLFVASGAQLSIDGSVAARMNAHWSPAGTDNGELVIDGIPLAAVSRLFSPQLPDMDGVIRGGVSSSGDLETNPSVHAWGRIENGSVRSLSSLDGDFELTLERNAARGHVRVDAGDAGTVNVAVLAEGDYTLPHLAESIRDGHYDFDAEIETLDLARIVAGLTGTNDAGIQGCVDGDLSFGGYLAFAPELDANLSIGDLRIGTSPPFEVAMTTRYDGQNLEVSASVGAEHDHDDEPSDDEAAPRSGRCRENAAAHLLDATTFAEEGLAEIYANMQAPLYELFGGAEAFASELQVVPWGLSVRVPPRRIGSLPSSIHAYLPASLDDFDAAMSFTALGGFGMVQASLAGSLDYAGDTDRFVCARGSRPRVSIWATHSNGDTRGTVEGFVGAERMVTAAIRTALPLEEWLADGAVGPMPPVSIDAEITPTEFGSPETPRPVESSGVPFLCEYFTGPFVGTLHADDVFTDHPTVGGALQSSQLQFRRVERSIRGTLRNAVDETPIIPQIALKFSGDSQRLEFNHDMTWWGDNDVSQVSGYLDWTWNREFWVPEIADDAAFELDLDAPATSGGSPDERIPSQLPLQILAGWIPLFGRVVGEVEANVHAYGTLNDPRIEGRLQISNATLVLESIGQRLRNVSGIVELGEGTANIRHLVAHDEDGTAAFDGTITFEGFTPTAYSITTDANAFPIRDEGSIIARLTGDATMAGTLGEDRMTTEVTIDDLDIALAAQSSQDPIELGEHPDVRIVGLSAAPPEDEEPYPMHIHIARTPRFWVRSDDFSAQVSTELDITYDSPDVRIVGDLELHRGYFEVFGKRFDVEQGSMVFDGGPRLDPLVSLVAIHHLRGGGRNDYVTVRAGGTLSAPTVDFSSPLVTSGDQGEILCVLITGSASSTGQCGESSNVSPTANQAGTQATEFLTGIAFGVATLALREQFGDIMPVIAIEGGSGGISPRLRAGFNVERYIPERLRRIVRGIYIEGYVSRQTNSPQVGAAASSSTTSGAQYGLSIELQFPHNIVTEGEYAQGNAWRLGVTWEP